MKMSRTKLVTLAFLAVVLAAAYFLGGSYPAPDSASFLADHGNNSTQTVEAPPAAVTPGTDQNDHPDSAQTAVSTAAATGSETGPDSLAAGVNQVSQASNAETPAMASPGTSPSDSSSASSSGPVLPPADAAPATVLAPENVPVSTDDSTTGTGVCTLSVNCSTVLNNLDKLDPAKAELVPAGGLVLAEQQVNFNAGESVFTLLAREMKRHHIHFEFEENPVYNSAYIEGIANIYEFDCGELSGWTYKVNGSFPGCGCSQYLVQEGDVVEIVYTCDLGRDIGAYISGVYN